MPFNVCLSAQQKSPARGTDRSQKPLVCKLVSYKPLAFRGVERRLALCGSRPCSCGTDRETAWGAEKPLELTKSNGRLSLIRAWVTCHSVPAAASFAFPVFVFGQQRFIVQSPTLQGRRTSFAFHSARHCFTLVPAPLKRARRRHGPSSTHEATLAPVRRDSAGVRNQCQKKITPRRPREGITRPRKYAVAPCQNLHI